MRNERWIIGLMATDERTNGWMDGDGNTMPMMNEGHETIF
jgi:hypothetical protein